MALTKVTLIADSTISDVHINNLTTDALIEGNKLFYTNDRVASYLAANNFATTGAGYFYDATLSANILTFSKSDGTTDSVDLSLYLDDTNLARLVSGTLDGLTGIATFTRDDSSTFTVDFSSFLADANDYVSSGSFDTSTGVLTLTRQGGGTVTVDLDGKYAEAVHTHDDRYYTELESDGRFAPISHTHLWSQITDRPTALSAFTNDLGNYGGFLTSFTETDPIYTASSWYTTTNNSSNWDTAFGWGNHATAGYLTSFTETDPTVPAYVKSITTTNITNWNTAFGWGNHANAGYQLASTAITTSNISSQSVNYATSAGTAIDLNAADSTQINFNNVTNTDYSTMTFTSRAWQDVQGVNGLAYTFNTHTNAGNGGYGALQIYYGESGYVYAPTSFRAPLFYDSNNTGYYVDPASTSRINAVQFDNIGVGQSVNGSYRIITSGDIYLNANGNGWAEGTWKQRRAGGTWYDVIDSGNIGSQSVNYANNAGTVGGFSAGTFYRNLGFGSGYPSWNLDTVDADRSGFTYSNAAPYTGPFIHIGASGYGLQLNAPYGGNGYGLSFRTRNGDAGSWNSWQYPAVYGINANGGGALYATVYYDQDDTGYYVNPTSSSILNGTVVIKGNDNQLAIDGTNGALASGLFFRESGINKYELYHYAGQFRFYNYTTNQQEMSIDNVGGYVTSRTSFRAPIFYDSNNTGYYVDPASTSVINELYLTGAINYSGSVAADSGYGLYFSTSRDSAYGIFREPGGWSHPYPDLRIAFHTGIKLGANAGYNGIRFYTDYDMSTQVMSVNNASDGYGAGHVHVNGIMNAGDSHRAPIFYDSNDTYYFVDPASDSRQNNITANRIGVNPSGSNSSRYGISLYGGYSGGEPTYGMLFTGTSLGTHGSVTGDWATYFTMNDSSSRGWIFRRVGSENVASISGGGSACFNGEVSAYSNVTSYGDVRSFGCGVYHCGPTTSWGLLASYGVSGNYFGDLYSMSTITGINIYPYTGENFVYDTCNGALYIGGTIYQNYYSDCKYKENITVIESALDKIDGIRGVEFDWNALGQEEIYKSGHEVGFIAQEVQAVYPQAVREVHKEREDKIVSALVIDQEKLIPLLLQGIKELKSEIKALKEYLNIS